MTLAAEPRQRSDDFSLVIADVLSPARIYRPVECE
jgi:hypothetical protein